MSTTTTTQVDRNTILSALDTWIRQRPGLEYDNYGNPTSYRAEVRAIGRDLDDARTLLQAVSLSSITTDGLLAAFRAYSGRLQWTEKGLDYCTGQYWPTEYRKAACAVLAAALWDYHITDYAGEGCGTALRAMFKRRFGKRIQERWFS